MKTTIFSTLMFAIFLHSLLLAANPISKKGKIAPGKAETTSPLVREETSSLAPVTPSTATFEESDTVDSSLNVSGTMKEMAPVTPGEATFEDSVIDTTSVITMISPSTPAEATFDDFASN